MVDRFTKMARFAPCAKTITGEETADLFFKNVVRLHGLPNDITSDRGPQFVSNFWWRLLQTFDCIVNLSSAYHLQTDGNTGSFETGNMSHFRNCPLKNGKK